MSLETIKRPQLQDNLETHWGLDPVAAGEVSSHVTSVGAGQINNLLSDVESLPEAVRKRDQNRLDIADILRGESDKQLIVVGPCSLDSETKDYYKLLDYIEELQEDHPDAIIALRLNGAKPRTSTGSTGLHNSTDSNDRQIQMSVFKDAFVKGIPILTEITSINEFALLAPYLSAMWLGARDMTSTSLRKVFSATRIPVLIKNGLDGTAKTVKNAIETIRANSADNKGSGVDLGFLSATYLINNMPASVTVGGGNPNVGIIARGFDLPENTGPIKRRRETFRHIGELCTLASQIDCRVLIDGSHSVPPMLKIEKSNRNRFPVVLDIIFKAAAQGRIANFERVGGLIGEIGTWEGTTDKNFDMLEAINRRRISLHLKRLRKIRDKAVRSFEDNAKMTSGSEV